MGKHPVTANISTTAKLSWSEPRTHRQLARAGSLQTDELRLQASASSKSHCQRAVWVTTVPQRLEKSALSDDGHSRYNDDRAAQEVQDHNDSILTCRQNWAQHWSPDAGRAVPAATRTKANRVPQLWTHTLGSAPGSQRKQGLCPTLSLTLPARARTHLHARPPRRLRPLRPRPRGRPPTRHGAAPPSSPGSSTGTHAILVADTARQPSRRRLPGPPARPPSARGSLPAEPRPRPAPSAARSSDGSRRLAAAAPRPWGCEAGSRGAAGARRRRDRSGSSETSAAGRSAPPASHLRRSGRFCRDRGELRTRPFRPQRPLEPPCPAAAGPRSHLPPSRPGSRYSRNRKLGHCRSRPSRGGGDTPGATPPMAC